MFFDRSDGLADDDAGCIESGGDNSPFGGGQILEADPLAVDFGVSYDRHGGVIVFTSVDPVVQDRDLNGAVGRDIDGGSSRST